MALLGVVAGAAAVLASPMQEAAANHTAFATPLPHPSVLTAPENGTVALEAREADVQVLPGNKTKMWTYGGSFPGPTIRQTSGKRLTLNVSNSLPAAGSLSVHNHGNHSKPEFDGRPHDNLIAPGSTYGYVYDGTEAGGGERAATQWYHDHAMDVTARNVWMGLAGMYIIDDPAEDALGLPSGPVFDIPLLFADRSFTSTNQLSYTFNPSGVTGDHILVNGVPQPFLEVGPAKYRLRILNASNIRDYEVALSTGEPLVQIGTEAGLLPAPVSRPSILLGPSERVDVVVDFAGLAGQDVVLRNLGASGAAGQLMQFRVAEAPTNTATVPAVLTTPTEDLSDDVIAARRTFVFDRKAGSWTINGKRFDPDRIEARPVLGTTEEWTFVNPSGWSHVAHTHDVDQQLMSRNGAPPQPWERTKEAWHIGGGQTVVVRLRFTDHVGPYLIHCHVLEHEDDGMMTQFEVVSPTTTPVTKTLALVSPTSDALVGGAGFEGSPDGAHADGGAAASNADGNGQSHVWSGYGLSGVPSDATVTGLAVRADWWVDGRRGTSSLGVSLSTDGSSWTAAKTDTSSVTRERSVTFGGATDLWGRAWTPAELASLEVRVTTTSTEPTRDFLLDWLPVTVTYTVPAAP